MKKLRSDKNTVRLLRSQGPVGAGADRSTIESLVEVALTRASGVSSDAALEGLASEIMDLDLTRHRVVVLGGGTGLSTVVGGNSRLPDWPQKSACGLKREFPALDVVVCTTDDGGSTGLLLRQLPFIAIGDLRKSCLSLIETENLSRTYHIYAQAAEAVIRIIHRIFNHRFAKDDTQSDIARDPLLLIPAFWRTDCPPRLAKELRALGTYAVSAKGLNILPGGHCLGNLILTAAIFRAAGNAGTKPPGLVAIRKGLDTVSRLVGVRTGHLHAATATPGQLKFRYANGVEVYGQSKSAWAHRGCPVEAMHAEFCSKPSVPAAVVRALENADLIIYAPGSLYTSIIPLLQLPPITQAIRSNRRALKVLAANFWIQEGETDISPRNYTRGFLVSELIEAYGRNVSGGIHGLFDTVLNANLRHIPGSILRSYALEGKRPIHLDRKRVEEMGLEPIEVTLFPPDHVSVSTMVHHDPDYFALAIRSLMFAHEFIGKPGQNKSGTRMNRLRTDNNFRLSRVKTPILSRYMSEMGTILKHKRFHPASLRKEMLDLIWNNRDIQAKHLDYFRGVKVLGAKDWERSTDWDHVLGYYDPEDELLKLHEQRLDEPLRLREDLLIALGESLLGRYVRYKKWVKCESLETCRARCYEIHLLPESSRRCFLDQRQLHQFLTMARMVRAANNGSTYRLFINDDEGFMPSGLLFGLFYAWYLNNVDGAAMDYEMSLLSWSRQNLIPHQAKERDRKSALVAFFRTVVFGNPYGSW